MLRVTLDVNSLVEGTISRQGPAGTILASWESGELALIVCDEIVTEYQDVLGRPHIRRRYAHINAETIAAGARTLHVHGSLVVLREIPSVVVSDPDDDVILACATTGTADYVVTRDRHLLSLAVYEGIPIVTPEAFLPILRDRGAGDDERQLPTDDRV